MYLFVELKQMSLIWKGKARIQSFWQVETRVSLVVCWFRGDNQLLSDNGALALSMFVLRVSRRYLLLTAFGVEIYFYPTTSRFSFMFFRPQQYFIDLTFTLQNVHMYFSIYSYVPCA